MTTSLERLQGWVQSSLTLLDAIDTLDACTLHEQCQADFSALLGELKLSEQLVSQFCELCDLIDSGSHQEASSFYMQMCIPSQIGDWAEEATKLKCLRSFKRMMDFRQS